MSQRQYDRVYVFRATVYGTLVGLLVLVVAILLQLFAEQEQFSWSFLVRLHALYPSFYLLDFLPVAVGCLTFYLFRRYSQLEHDREAECARRSRHQETLYRFVESMRRGEREAFTPAVDDALGQALVELDADLTRSRSEDQRRQEAEKLRGWKAEGEAEFGAILRRESDDLHEMAYQVIRTLVGYIGANQGGVYLAEGGEADGRYGSGSQESVGTDTSHATHFTLMACYAYDRRKYSDQTIPWGSGLVGACAIEGVTMQLDKIPEGYLSITSGLGHATARNLLLVPLLHEGGVYGVLEIASFEAFDSETVDFVERVARTIASTLSNKRINERTKQLLEASIDQRQKLLEKEQELQSNLEELKVTQEESQQKSKRFESFSNSVNQTLIRAEFTTDGVVKVVNEKFLTKLEYTQAREVENKDISMFINAKDRLQFQRLWERVAHEGEPFEGDLKLLTRTGKDLWTIATFTVQRNDEDVVEEILFLAIDITADKIQNLDWQNQIEALNRVSLKVEITPLGDILDVNSMFEEVLGYPLAETVRKPFRHLIPKNVHAQYEQVMSQVSRGESFEGTMRFLDCEGRELWCRVSMAGVVDMYGDISKIIVIANDITREKEMELETRQQKELLERQGEQLRRNEVELSKKLREARDEVKRQFREIEAVQMRNERTLEGFLDAIVTTNQYGVIEFFNKAAEELFGILRTEVLGQNVRLIFPQETVERNTHSKEFLERYLDPEQEKNIGKRYTVKVYNLSDGKELETFMLLSKAEVNKRISYTAFIQNTTIQDVEEVAYDDADLDDIFF